MPASDDPTPDDPLADHAIAILEHMNGDHADTLALYCAAFRGRPGLTPRMIGVDARGFDVIDFATGERFRFEFPEPAHTPEAVRRHLVQLAREARARLAAAPP